MWWLETISSIKRLWRFILAAVLAAIFVMTQGCSTQQLYGTGQSWQRNECQRLVDQYERERCLSNANTSYDAYQKQLPSK